MADRVGQQLSGDYFEPSRHGTTEADLRHVSPAEATEALDLGERGEELPEADERFDGEPDFPEGPSSPS